MAFPIGTAAVSWVEGNNALHIRVYTTDGYNVTERCWDGSWTDSAFSQTGAAVSATCWQKDGNVSIRVYCTFEDNTVEWCTDDGGANWYKGGY